MPELQLGQDLRPDDRLDAMTIAAARAEWISLKTQRDGWMEIAGALLEVAFGAPMRGFVAAIPPRELIEPLVARQGDAEETIAKLRDAMMGRAWRAAGPDGKGTCAYPLCAHRKDSPRPKLTTVRIRDAKGVSASIAVCDLQPALREMHSLPGECFTWAQWVESRAHEGRIFLR